MIDGYNITKSQHMGGDFSYRVQGDFPGAKEYQVWCPGNGSRSIVRVMCKGRGTGASHWRTIDGRWLFPIINRWEAEKTRARFWEQARRELLEEADKHKTDEHD